LWRLWLGFTSQFPRFPKFGAIEMSAELFKKFRAIISVQNAGEISKAYNEITQCLNRYYWGSESETANSRQVGSYGRQTAIHGVSDLDMAFVLPNKVYERFHAYESNGQSALLQEVKHVVQGLYNRKEISGDGQIVSIPFRRFKIELLPVFLDENADYVYADTNNGGSWKTTKPIKEIDAITELNKEKNRNLKRLCKMVRSWKNTNGVNMGGLLIDTFCYNFLNQTKDYDSESYESYKYMVRDFFAFLVAQDESQTQWRAPGSNQVVHKKGAFHPKAKKAHRCCQEALEDEATSHKKWKKVFGKDFPKPVIAEAVAKSFISTFRDTEEFIEDQYPVDIRYDLTINCEVQNESSFLRALMRRANLGFQIPKQRRLKFFVENINVKGPFDLKWKVLNIGPVAEEKDQIRGQIHDDEGKAQRIETSSFNGDHFVECYAIKNGVCVARCGLKVPIC
jgi:hypothetical protein